MTVDDVRARTRQQVLEVATVMLEREGARAVSTRAVAAAAGIRAASLYQLFGDKDGLLTALAGHAFDRYLADKQALAHTDDPVADLRRGWDAHVDFGLRHPASYLLMHGTDRPGRRPAAAAAAHDLLLAFLDRAAAAGRLTVSPATAAHLFLAASTGVTLALIGAPAGEPDGEPDLEVSTRMRETLVGSITTDRLPATAPGLAPQALALDAALTAGSSLPLTPTETALLHDWLLRLAG